MTYDDNACISFTLTDDQVPQETHDIRTGGDGALTTQDTSEFGEKPSDDGGIYGGSGGTEAVPLGRVKWMRWLPCNAALDMKGLRTIFHWIFDYLDRESCNNTATNVYDVEVANCDDDPLIGTAITPFVNTGTPLVRLEQFVENTTTKDMIVYINCRAYWNATIAAPNDAWKVTALFPGGAAPDVTLISEVAIPPICDTYSQILPPGGSSTYVMEVFLTPTVYTEDAENEIIGCRQVMNILTVTL